MLIKKGKTYFLGAEPSLLVELDIGAFPGPFELPLLPRFTRLLVPVTPRLG
jgi:hypothetical protein